MPTSPQALGVCCTTFGCTPLTHEEQAEAEARLDFRYVRLPVGVRGGHVTSSARGAPRGLDTPRLARWYQERGARIDVTLGGRTTDLDSEPGDAERIARAFVAAGVDLDGVNFSGPNEPNNHGWLRDSGVPLLLQRVDRFRSALCLLGHFLDPSLEALASGPDLFLRRGVAGQRGLGATPLLGDGAVSGVERAQASDCS